ncbi:hypothetical protein ACIB24_18850 [Spongisporangium articulatum]|uniref:Uncharacterized protein n=1 Tax=Spongisporangium articulatum TaxID=3362603 RepID=A0ABW8AU35_9ACTN
MATDARLTDAHEDDPHGRASAAGMEDHAKYAGAHTPEPVVEEHPPGVRYLHAQVRPASPTWFGAIMFLGILTMAVILLTYTLVDWQWQQDLGVWNYWVAIALIPLLSFVMRFWQPDERVWEDQRVGQAVKTTMDTGHEVAGDEKTVGTSERPKH